MASGQERERTIALIAYALHLFGAVAGLPSLIALVMNYLCRSDRSVTSHHSWMIMTFWWAILWIVVGAVLTLVVVGWAVLALTWLWYLYRHIIGLYRLFQNEPAPG